MQRNTSFFPGKNVPLDARVRQWTVVGGTIFEESVFKVAPVRPALHNRARCVVKDVLLLNFLNRLLGQMYKNIERSIDNKYEARDKLLPATQVTGRPAGIE